MSAHARAGVGGSPHTPERAAAAVAQAAAEGRHALFQTLTRAVAPRLCEFKPVQLASLVSAHGAARELSPALFDALATELRQRVPLQRQQQQQRESTASAKSENSSRQSPPLSPRELPISPREISTIAWAAAATRVRSGPLFLALSELSRVGGGLGRFDERSLASLAWAYAAADPPMGARELFAADESFVDRCAALPWVDPTHLNQVSQIYTHCPHMSHPILPIFQNLIRFL